MQIKEIPFEERPMEKLLFQGAKVLSDVELLAILINTGTRDKSALTLAYELLESQGHSLKNFGEISEDELEKISGIGEKKACRILGAIEFGKRIYAHQDSLGYQISTSKDVVDYMRKTMRYEKRETFALIALNTKGMVIFWETVAIGSLTEAIIHPREAFKPLVKKSATSVIFVHNHPSGDPSPSKDDINLTKRLIQCGDLLGIKVLDHIIIGRDNHLSLCEMGYI